MENLYKEASYVFSDDILIAPGQHTLNRDVFDFGEIYLKLSPPLNTQWEANGELGSQYEETPDGKIKVLNENFFLEGLPISNCDNKIVEVHFEPFTDGCTKNCTYTY